MTGNGDRRSLPMPDFGDDLDDFRPRHSEGKGAPSADAKAIDATSGFPSREASRDAQINMRGPQHVLERFKAMCKADRRTYHDMLEILMHAYEEGR